jgi:hypothetical protein
MGRSRMRDPGQTEDARRGKLVVRGEQRPRAVHDLHALPLEPREAPEPGLDPIERRQDVEPCDRNISAPDTRQRGSVCDLCPLTEVGKGRGQSAVRLRSFADDEDLSPARYGWPPRSRAAIAPLGPDLEFCNRHRASTTATSKVGVRPS